MSDIVDRLYRLDADHCGVIDGLGEGAREIERLRAINAELLAALEWIAEDDGGRAGECARAAIAKSKGE